MKAQANQSGGNANSKASEQSSGSSSIGHWFRDRASATAEGAAAFGPGVEGQATKRLGSAPDSTAESFVVGEGLYAGATGNFEAFRWGQQTSTGPTGKLVIDPASYVHIKVAGVIAFGVSVDLYPHGGAVTVSVGIGAGEYAIVKPPATISLEQNW